MLNTWAFHDPTIYLRKKKKNGTRLMIEKKKQIYEIKTKYFRKQLFALKQL